MIFAVHMINYIILGVLAVCFAYQAVYFFIPYLKKEKEHRLEKRNRFAVLIAARHEEGVIGHLIESIRMQDYPEELLDIYVAADNCNDNTARVAREKGAFVYERFNKIQVGKGYALNYLLNAMKQDGRRDQYDGYFIFDADNLLDRNYIKEMNRTFCDGFRVITSYRNTKNFGSNWLTSGYGLWFLHEAQWLNRARMLAGTSCAVSGTGFFFSREILERMGEWNYFLLTEDIEFTVSQILQGEKIGYNKNAIFYDEQPERFVQSWHQRARWVKGYQQVFAKYGKQIAKGIFKDRNFSCFDMTMSIWPAFAVTAFSIGANLALILAGLLTDQDISFAKTYGMMGLLGAWTLFTEWKQIHASAGRKLFSLLTFPGFMFTFAPIAFVAIVKKVEWKPIEHRCIMGVGQLHVHKVNEP